MSLAGLGKTTILAAIVVGIVGSVSAQENWPRFRGENGAGTGSQAGLPDQWSEKDYAWTVDIPGKGHSSPIVWGEKLFLTTAIPDAATGGTLRQLRCLSATTGDTIWVKGISLESSHLHKKSSWASGTPATDGKMVYVAFADEKQHKLVAFDFDGTLVWTKELGPFTSQHGQGSSPILFEDLVILPNDQMGPSEILAFKKSSGELAWRTKREFRKTSYATPMIHVIDGQAQLICVSGAMGVCSLDPRSGKLNWKTEPFPMRTVASPVFANGLIFASCGSGSQGKLLFGVDPKLDVNPTERVRIRRQTTLPYVPTPVEHGGRLFLWTDRGIVVCLDPKDGKEVWRDRVRGNFSGSPICVDGKLYCVSESGDVVVVAAAPEFKLLGRTSLGAQSYATPAVANGRLYLRTFKRLMCLAAKS